MGRRSRPGWNVPELSSQIDKLRTHNEELDQQSRFALNRMFAKQEIVDQVYNGRLTLREAATRFRNLNAANPKFLDQSRLCYPGCSDDECQYWNVIACARNSHWQYSDKNRFVTRLTEELRRLDQRGELTLGD